MAVSEERIKEIMASLDAMGEELMARNMSGTTPTVDEMAAMTNDWAQRLNAEERAALAKILAEKEGRTEQDTERLRLLIGVIDDVFVNGGEGFPESLGMPKSAMGLIKAHLAVIAASADIHLEEMTRQEILGMGVMIGMSIGAQYQEMRDA